MTKRMLYRPINTLKPVTDDLWIVDGPITRFGLMWAKMPFPTRMTVIRLKHGLFVHSPTQLDRALKEEIEEIGPVRWIIAPNRIHYSWIPDWHAAFGDAEVYLAPKVREQARERIDFDGCRLDSDKGYPWDAELETLPVRGRYMTEVVFLHRASRTLILTDLIENFEPGKLNVPMRWLTRLGGVQDPNGSMPRDMRVTFHKTHLTAAIEKMLAWAPVRIVLAHGRWYESNGDAELKRAFQWLYV